VTEPRYLPLDDVAEHVTVGYVGPSSEYFCLNGIPFLRTGNVGARQIFLSNLKYVVPEFHSKQKKSALKPGDVVVSRVISDEINAAVIPAELDGANCGNIIVIRPGARVHPEYLAHLISSPMSQRELLGRQVGSAQAVINTNVLKGWKIPVVSINEQRRIAAILDKADQLRARRRAALAQLDTLIQAYFLNVFGSPVVSQTKWPTTSLEEACEKITDGTHNSPPNHAKGIPYVTAKHLKEHGLDFESDPWFVSEADHRQIFARCDPRQGDVLYIKDGATTGIAAINHYSFEFSMLSSLALIRPKPTKLVAEYLCFWLNNPLVKRELLGGMAGAAIRRLTIAKLKAIRLPIPPVALQRKFASRVCAVEKMNAAHRTSLAQMDALFASLQHRAFRGEL
jgi:type I restriction enzyme, S subunit